MDRIQRSQAETPLLDELIRQGKLELHFNSKDYIIHSDHSTHEMMIWGMGIVVAKSHTDLLSRKFEKSLKRKRCTMKQYGPAPLNYLNK